MLQALLCAQGKIKDSWNLLPALHISCSSDYDLSFRVLITVCLEIFYSTWDNWLLIFSF